ncbi:MAG: 5'-nucleotidase/UDP-sugar diphosphatase [Planctomycetota bacterium]|jgi:5'-nucleotidase/UDP-sugar diphosphatase
MRLHRTFLLVPLFLLSVRAPLPERLHLVVLHTNDVHGQLLPRTATWMREEPKPLVGGVERFANYVESVRADAPDSVLLVDGGDWFQGTPEGMIDDGDAFMKVLARVGYDAMCVGNHEFDYGVDALQGQLAETEVPAVLTGVTNAEGRSLPGIPEYLLLERAGLRIAVVGLVTPSTPDITHESTRALLFESPSKALARVRAELDQLEPPVDLVLPLTHIGVNSDRVLAKAHPDLPLIVGGHSHTFLKNGVNEGTVSIVQTGTKLSAVGRVDLWFDADTKELLKKSVRVVSLLEEVPAAERDEELAQACAKLVKRSAKVMDEVLGELVQGLQRASGKHRSSTAGNFITDTMRDYAKADVAIQNQGGIRTNLAAGAVDRRALFELLPFGNNLVVLTMTGSQLEAIVRRSVEGMAHTPIEFSGMQVTVSVDDAATRLEGIQLAGRAIVAEARYRVATNSFLAGGGDGYIEFAAIQRRDSDPILLRDLLARAFEGKAKVQPASDNRILVLKP